MILEVVHAGSSLGLLLVAVYVATRVRRSDINEIAREIRAERADLKEAIHRMGQELQLFVKTAILDHEAHHHGIESHRDQDPE